MKRIALVYNGELDFGGVEAHLLSILKHLDKKSYSPMIISPVSLNYRQKALALGAQVIPIPPLQPLGIRQIWQLAAIFRQENIDLVHIHSPIAAISARIAAKLIRLPVVVTVHLPSTQFYGNIMTLRAKVGRTIFISLDRILNYSMTDRLVYVSSSVHRESIQSHLSPKHISTVIPNGIDLSEYANIGNPMVIREKLSAPPGAIVLCFAGRLSTQKGIDILLSAVADLVKIHPSKDIKLWVIGDGPLKRELEAETQSLGLGRTVVFIGFQERISEYLHASDIFILPSRHEGMSIVLLEALACGLPCIVTDVGENSEVIENAVQGLIIPPNQSEALTKAMDKLLNDPSLREQMKSKSFERAKVYSDEKMVNSLNQLYRELLHQ